MERFRNWRWYKKFSGGPIADLGSHQIDIFNWFLQARPKAVMAMGGVDYNPNIEWYDNIQALYEWDFNWEGETKVVRGEYHTLCTTSHLGFQETFVGNEGSLIISEVNGVGGIRREQAAPVADWEKPLQASLGKIKQAKEEEKKGEPPGKVGEGEVKLGHSVPMPGRYYPPVAALEKPEHVPHLENFFDAIRGKAKLNCPGEDGLETCVTVLRVNEAVAAGKRLEFRPDEFKA
jgi:predicted dehydrogenase